MKFIQRILVINSNSNHKQDGVVILRVLISLFENLPGQINEAMPTLVGMLLAEIKVNFENKCPQNYRAMLFQAFATAIYNNSALTLQITETE